MRPGRSEETAQQVFSVNDPVLPAIGPPAAELEAYYGENVAFGDFFRKLRMEEFVHYSFFELCIPFKGSISAQLCITLEPPTTLTDQSYRIFSGILKSNTS